MDKSQLMSTERYAAGSQIWEEVETKTQPVSAGAVYDLAQDGGGGEAMTDDADG